MLQVKYDSHNYEALCCSDGLCYFFLLIRGKRIYHKIDGPAHFKNDAGRKTRSIFYICGAHYNDFPEGKFKLAKERYLNSLRHM